VALVGTKRKLTAIMAADVVGYSRLVAADDESTVRRLHEMRDLIGPIVERHEGRLFGEAGDSLMTEFPSAVEAMRCALEVQREVAGRNVGMAPDRAMSFRIGINIGEVIVEGDNLYGDGVNIAARLQEIAEPGGVVLSAAAYEQIKNKVAIDVEPLGLKSLKNIPEQVPVFRARDAAPVKTAPAASPRHSRVGWRQRAFAAAAGVAVLIGGAIAWDLWAGPQWQFKVFKAEAAQPLPTIPSIVVMPFLNASENEAQEYFCLGIAEDIITALTKVQGLFVVGRDSAMSFKGKAVSARQVGRDLGVRYVLQGSVRRADNRVRISTYLVDAATEQTVWAARYDRELGDIFAVQDDISGKITTALAVSFRPGERESLQQVAQVPASYDLFVQARQKMIPPSPQNLIAAEDLFTKITNSERSFAGGWAGLSLTKSMRVTQGFIADPAEREKTIRSAIEYANEALKVDSRSAMALFSKSLAELQQHHQDAALKFAREAYDIQPGDAYIAASLGLMYSFVGKPRDGYKYLEEAIERERVPIYRGRAEYFMLQAAYLAGDYKKAEQAYHANLESAATCFADCLFFAASTKAELAGLAKSEEEANAFNKQAADILDTLRKRYSNYEQTRLFERIKMYKENGDQLKIQQAAKSLAAISPKP